MFQHTTTIFDTAMSTVIKPSVATSVTTIVTNAAIVGSFVLLKNAPRQQWGPASWPLPLMILRADQVVALLITGRPLGGSACIAGGTAGLACSLCAWRLCRLQLCHTLLCSCQAPLGICQLSTTCLKLTLGVLLGFLQLSTLVSNYLWMIRMLLVYHLFVYH